MKKKKKIRCRRIKKKLKLLLIILIKKLKTITKNPKLIFDSTMQITLGSALMAISTNVLYIPHGLLSGGIGGISLMLHYLLSFNLGWTIFALNIPLFLIGIKFLNITFIIQSWISMGLYSIIINYSQFLQNKIHLNDMMLVSILAGLISGLGLGLIFKGKGSSGGSDIIAMIIKEKYSISIGTTNFIVNLMVLILATFFFNIEIALYTLIASFVTSIMTDKTSTGFGNQKAILIISDKGKEIAYLLTNKLKLGATLIDGKGAWAGTEKTIVFIVVPIMRLSRIKYISQKVDPNCFITVINTNEITGGKIITDPISLKQEISN
ncbi:YitT family protein [Borreliella americana]|uniref:YitT family protein n=1 Tax=Borreliella americana TaxID=478807 RepID=UPI001E29041E|nr:YitT family protein [Borreliella americana]MCD2332534.1 YitT family protein [Borreliella americana]MCD2349662.1 YitT family protein [Borreliella americana]MCD2382075.1 YitT family protein [Borreliella americana]